jgi:hypothetical protein
LAGLSEFNAEITGLMPQAYSTSSDLTLRYDRHSAMHHLDGVIDRGSLLGLVGGTRLAHLSQQSEPDRSLPARVIDLVSTGLRRRRGLLSRHRAEGRAAIAKALMAVDLAGLEKRPIDNLSGGQTQRALFARVLAPDADLILLDELSNALDARRATDLVASDAVCQRPPSCTTLSQGLERECPRVRDNRPRSPTWTQTRFHRACQNGRIRTPSSLS